MKIAVRWQAPIELRDDSDSWKATCIYKCDLSGLPDEPGVYVFARRFGKSIEPLYVGQAGVLQFRIRQQLNNVRLMRGIQNASIGGRVLIVGTLSLRPGQRLATALDVVETALIERFAGEGHALLNKQGTRNKSDEVVFSGSRVLYRLLSAQVTVPRRLKARARN